MSCQSEIQTSKRFFADERPKLSRQLSKEPIYSQPIAETEDEKEQSDSQPDQEFVFVSK